MKLTGNQTLAAAGVLFFVALFGYMWSVERRESSPILAALPAAAEAPPAKRIKAREMVTDLYADKRRNDGEDSFTQATRSGFLRDARVAAERAEQRASASAPRTASQNAPPSAGPDPAAPVQQIASTPIPEPVPSEPAEDPDSERTKLLAASARRIDRLCMRIKSDDGSSMPELKSIADSEPSYTGHVWEAVFDESQRVLRHYGADPDGMWEGLAANDYMVRISSTTLDTCGSMKLASIIFEAIDPRAPLLDRKALDRFVDDALEALE